METPVLSLKLDGGTILVWCLHLEYEEYKGHVHNFGNNIGPTSWHSADVDSEIACGPKLHVASECG